MYLRSSRTFFLANRFDKVMKLKGRTAESVIQDMWALLNDSTSTPASAAPEAGDGKRLETKGESKVHAVAVPKVGIPSGLPVPHVQIVQERILPVSALLASDFHFLSRLEDEQKASGKNMIEFLSSIRTAKDRTSLWNTLGLACLPWVSADEEDEEDTKFWARCVEGACC
jgi:hypothetical protein